MQTTILAVEDEALIRMVSADILTDAGHRVIMRGADHVGSERRWSPSESFTFNRAKGLLFSLKRDYVPVNPRPNAQSVIDQLPG